MSHTTSTKAPEKSSTAKTPSKKPLVSEPPISGLRGILTDPTIATPTQVLHLQRLAGNRAVNQLLEASTPRQVIQIHPSAANIVQRAGEYRGLLPEHTTYSDTYTFEGGSKDDFTYHHIIPENRLHEVLAKLNIIFGSDVDSEDMERLRSGSETLKGGARELWIDTRTRNTTYAINHEFKDYGVAVDGSEIKKLIVAQNTHKPLFDAIAALIFKSIQARLEPDFTTMKGKLRKGVVEILKGPERDWLWAVSNLVGKIKFNGKPIFQSAEVENIIASTPKGRRGTNKGNIIRGIEEYSAATTFDVFYRTHYPELQWDYSGTTTSLKKVVKENGLPRDNQDELTDAVTWIPGNIHRGPSSKLRINPKDKKNFKVLLDDGGETFEKAAANLVAQGHYELLARLNEHVETLNGTAEEDLTKPENVKLAADMLGEMVELQKFGVTQFNKDAWQEISVNTGTDKKPKMEKKMRLVKNKSKLRSVGLMKVRFEDERH